MSFSRHIKVHTYNHTEAIQPHCDRSSGWEMECAFMGLKLEVKHKYHPNPRLSANQVADYLDANATNRRNILRDAKFPPIILLIPYSDAKSALVGHFSRNQAESQLDSRVQALRRKAELPEISDFERRNCYLCVEAIESFQAAEPKMKLGKIKFSRPGSHFPKLKISGVSVSVSIDLLTEKLDTKGGGAKGAAMLVFSKGGGPQKNMPERCKAISLLIFELLKDQAKPGQIYDPTMCMAVDVFRGIVYPAKGEQRQLWKTVGTSCDEVTRIWPSVPPPANYNGPPLPKFA